MPFTIKETIGGLNHLWLKWERKLWGRTRNYYVDKLAAERQGEAFFGIVAKSEPCPICGYAMARLRLNDGWILETCSSTGLKQLIDNRKFIKWCQQLHSMHTLDPNPSQDQLPT